MGYTQNRRLEELLARELVLAFALLLVAMAQVALLPRPLNLAPNLLLLLVVCHGLLSGTTSAARWAFYGGISLDLCSNSPLGTHALALLVATIVPTRMLVRLSRNNWLLPILGVALGSVAYHLILGALMALLVAPMDPLAYLVVTALPDMLVVVIPALPVFLVMRWREWRRRNEVQIDVY